MSDKAQRPTRNATPGGAPANTGSTSGDIRIVLVDDHALVRQGFRRILEDEPDLAVIGEAGSGLDAIEIVKTLQPDVVVMDMSMPEMNGLHAAREILKQRPSTRILILSMYSDEQYVRNALDAGAHGYILKGALETDMIRAVRAVAAGQQYLSPELAGALIRALQSKTGTADEDPYDRLTQREKQVLQLIAHGKSNKDIAVLLDLSVITVAVHRANLMNTLQIHKAAELVLYAVKRGLVIPE
jgi:DNA-binding NarL/FixJ family response regulator